MEEIDAIASIYDPALVKAAKVRPSPAPHRNWLIRLLLPLRSRDRSSLRNLKTDSKEANAVPEAAAPEDPKEAEKNPQARRSEADAMIHELLHGKEAK